MILKSNGATLQKWREEIWHFEIVWFITFNFK